MCLTGSGMDQWDSSLHASAFQPQAEAQPDPSLQATIKDPTPPSPTSKGGCPFGGEEKGRRPKTEDGRPPCHPEQTDRWYSEPVELLIVPCSEGYPPYRHHPQNPHQPQRGCMFIAPGFNPGSESCTNPRRCTHPRTRK